MKKEKGLVVVLIFLASCNNPLGLASWWLIFAFLRRLKVPVSHPVISNCLNTMECVGNFSIRWCRKLLLSFLTIWACGFSVYRQ